MGAEVVKRGSSGYVCGAMSLLIHPRMVCHSLLPWKHQLEIPTAQRKGQELSYKQPQALHQFVTCLQPSLRDLITERAKYYMYMYLRLLQQ